jgi:hypothetical protein
MKHNYHEDLLINWKDEVFLDVLYSNFISDNCLIIFILDYVIPISPIHLQTYIILKLFEHRAQVLNNKSYLTYKSVLSVVKV